ncbi:hypothetical protein NDU88_001041, partial [Pleurodeles waltl]
EKGSQLESKRGTTRQLDHQHDIINRSTTVINPSPKILKDNDFKALEKGLGFVPTPKLDIFKLKIEMAELFRNIRLKTFFLNHHEPNTGQDRNTGLRAKSR